MNKAFILFSIYSLFTFSIYAQEKEPIEVAQDSLQTNLKKEGVVIQESFEYSSIEVDPLAPSKAAFYSAILPGLGQVYNKKYWKAPIVVGLFGLTVYGYTFNNSNYNRVRDAFKSRKAGFTNDEFSNEDGTPRITTEALQGQQERFQRDRDLMLLLAIAVYAINIIDANVDAHLQQHNIDTNLSMDFKPFITTNPVSSNINYGMKLVIHF